MIVIFKIALNICDLLTWNVHSCHNPIGHLSNASEYAPALGPF